MLGAARLIMMRHQHAFVGCVEMFCILILAYLFYKCMHLSKLLRLSCISLSLWVFLLYVSYPSIKLMRKWAVSNWLIPKLSFCINESSVSLGSLKGFCICFHLTLVISQNVYFIFFINKYLLRINRLPKFFFFLLSKFSYTLRFET